MYKPGAKFSSLIIAAVISAGVFTGCGNSPQGGNDNDNSANNAGTSGSKVISFWHMGTEGSDQICWEYAIDKYNKERSPETGYTIEGLATQNDSYKQKLVIAMSSGECPDMYTHWSGGPMNDYVDAGFANPITDKFAAIEDRFMEAAVAQTKYNGEVYAIPILNCAVAGIFYNTEIYEKYNLSEPATLEELESNCEVLVENGIIPFALANQTQWTGSMYYMYFATRMGGLEPFKEAAAGTGTFESDNFVYAGEKIQEWVDRGFFPEGVNGLDNDAGQARQLMYTEKAAMELMGSWQVSTYKYDSEEDGSDFYGKASWFPFPALKDKDDTSSLLVGTIGDNFLSFNCDGEKLEEAFECASYYSSDEGVKVLVGQGKIPPINGVQVEEPMSVKIMSAIERASDIQLWYDQYLPLEVSDVHKTESQKLFDKSSTPQEVNKAQQDAMQKYIAENE